MNEMLTVQNLTKTYPIALQPHELQSKRARKRKKFAVNDLSFSVKKGEIFGLIGPGESGKTTLLQLISTLAKPQDGSISMAGIDVLKEPAKARRRIGYMAGNIEPEEYTTPDKLFDFYAKIQGVATPVAEGRKDRLFEALKIEPFAEKPFLTLKPGIRQKVIIALSLVHNPDFIILDDPTSEMDIVDVMLVADLLESLKAEQKTVLIASRNLSLLQKVCDRTGILMDGKMVSIVDTNSSLEEKFYELYKGVSCHV